MPFAAIFIPNFMFQAIVRCEPELRVHPVAVIEGQPPIYYVVAVNRLADKLGVAVGMTKANAEQFQQVQIRPLPLPGPAHSVRDKTNRSDKTNR